MNGALPLPNRLPSVEDFLKFEEGSRIRHEYIAGEIFAMAGTSLRHNRISLNMATAFTNHLRGGPCQAYISDVKVRLKINQDHYFYYPDVMVACDREDEGEHYLRNPKLIIEVLSPSTESIDRREKALHYRWIPTLEEYVLVAQDVYEVTIHRRSENWEPIVYTSPEAVIEFRSIHLSISLAQLYESAF